MPHVGQRLRERRLQLGLTVSETARRAHISRAYLQRIERPDSQIAVSIDVLTRLSGALDTTSAEMLRDEVQFEPAMPPSLVAFLEEFEVDEKLAWLLNYVASKADRELSRDDWMVLARTLRDTIEWRAKRGAHRSSALRRRESVDPPESLRG